LLSSCVGALDDQICSMQGGSGACCAGRCLYMPTDPSACGVCGERCGDGTVCYARGSCILPAACDRNDNGALCALDSGVAGTCCQGVCADLSSDRMHCRDCGSACPIGGSCDGSCSSWAGNDWACDAGCPTGRACASGICYIVTCGQDDDGIFCLVPDGGWSTRSACCGGRCVDFSVSDDPANCFACGNVCPPGQTCFGGSCGVAVSCTANGVRCWASDGGASWAGGCCGGQCLSDYGDVDFENCGGCGLGCPIGATCELPGGACVDDAGLWFPCQQSGDCQAGRVCAGGYCVPPSCDAGTTSCAAPTADGGAALGICCGTLCTDPTSDDANCGSCGQSCPPGLTCTSGGVNYPYRTCLDPSLSTSCGAQFPCGPGFVCNGAACLPPICLPGMEGNPCSYSPDALGICCGDRCVDRRADPRNCGVCGYACGVNYCFEWAGCVGSSIPQRCLQSCGPGSICAQTQCVNSVCGESSPFCLANDGSVGVCCPNGACATPASDPQNCGSCGIVCPPGATCQNGLCNGLAECGAGHAGSYCNLAAGVSFLCCPGLGCIDTASDPANCGGCGTICPSGKSCTAGSCG